MPSELSNKFKKWNVDGLSLGELNKDVLKNEFGLFDDSSNDNNNNNNNNNNHSDVINKMDDSALINDILNVIKKLQLQIPIKLDDNIKTKTLRAVWCLCDTHKHVPHSINAFIKFWNEFYDPIKDDLNYNNNNNNNVKQKIDEHLKILNYGENIGLFLCVFFLSVLCDFCTFCLCNVQYNTLGDNDRVCIAFRHVNCMLWCFCMHFCLHVCLRCISVFTFVF